MSDVHDTPAVEDQDERMIAARAKADAARAAVERRRSLSSGPNERSRSAGSHHSNPADAVERSRSANGGSRRASSEGTGEVIIKHRPSSGGVTPNRSHTPVSAGAGAARRSDASAAEAAAEAQRAAAHADDAAAAAAAAAATEEKDARDDAVANDASDAHVDAARADAHDEVAADDDAAEASDATESEGVADYAAAVEELRREQEALAHDDSNLEQRLQLYSEVVGLRKELTVVQEDEERLRQQLANTEAVIAASDPEVAKEVAILEDEAQQSTLQKIWAEESEYHNPDNMDWAEIDVNNLRERVEAARAKFAAASEKADALYAQQEEAINETTDAREKEKTAIAENHEREMDNLADARANARQLASEQHYHRHRGTAKRAQPLVSKEKECQTRERRVDEVEFKTTAQVAKMKDELAELMEEVKVLKHNLDDSRETTETKLREHEAALKVIEDEGADAREMKEKLSKEEEELKELKADLQGVMHYVRAKNREEEGW
ncbi:hypothetical protein ABB37_00069 [Leptomonas pyrrhocoris]|uniref:Uncharacterized protein n=1 Tax=Leptomonas pyrrhocoris TaxID=157538 RepID=A0A0N0DZV7_LEPPY|nr:hypothetical protein ABB37_00069 [Leptomonas pyrrhocoris]XP_015664119.1 hypothetical protein ABB37_00069 [Leptomonas pyrrhocoris]XP_015664120.1 hypothetical protein ABB37_00069 [Leptomonas pyrrhocoris]XP_015664121.1 hypothetical protein ABB37_00069 [Leptomonas pyrrhocoris]XP_015664122.1 hypothetical protein ABB37_00069 [Leptomonas pyrrhocoris]XP_015664123.1 hypothetical protein ABB37_00069 [Leptomonas pyrrhocoris]KPA85679.1 hypothetical protein ABB37_00069 [Leptomonas pyrrhocoris]KPA85680|eukprot:XP_015664118.1 hypothetical protein ABB37_00069 [Leptomonas pyrrhocoris]